VNWVDYTILAVLGISVLIGLFRGLISEVLSLLIWVAAFWIARTFGPVVAGYFEHSIPQPSARLLVGYGLCFVLVLVVGAIVRFVVARLVWSTGLGGSDRLLGMIFGLARGVLVVGLLVFLCGFTPLPRDAWWRESQLLPQFTGVASWLGDKLPSDMGKYLHPSDVLDHLPTLPAGLPLPGHDKKDQIHPAAASSATST
jgi:membrane protein required for colicin V production